MNEQQIRQRMKRDGYTWEEIEDEVSDWAEDQIDNQRDREAEEYFARKEKQ